MREGDVYKVYGNKTWITHPVRADLMTLLVRTNPKDPGYQGLSMLLAESRSAPRALFRSSPRKRIGAKIVLRVRIGCDSSME